MLPYLLALVGIALGVYAWRAPVHHEGRSTAAIIVGVVALMAAVIVPLIDASERQEAAACARMLAASRTHADSFAVQMRCEFPQPSRTTVAPVPVIVPLMTR